MAQPPKKPYEWSPGRGTINLPQREAAAKSGLANVRNPACGRFHSNDWVRSVIGEYPRSFERYSDWPYGILQSQRDVTGDLQLTYNGPGSAQPYGLAWNDLYGLVYPPNLPTGFKRFRDGDITYNPEGANSPYTFPPTPLLGTIRLVWYVKDDKVVDKTVEGSQKVGHVIAYLLQPGQPEPSTGAGAPAIGKPRLWLLEQYDTTRAWFKDGNQWAQLIMREMGRDKTTGQVVVGGLVCTRPIALMGDDFDLQKEGGDESQETCVSWALAILYYLASEAKNGKLNLRTVGIEEIKQMYTFLHDNPGYKSQISGVVKLGGKRTRTRRKRKGSRRLKRKQ